MYNQVVKTQTIQVTNASCEDGKNTFDQVTFDWEEYGTATRPDGSRKPVVVILPFFLGTARAAGHSGVDKVTNKPKSVGYWDGLIGPGDPINTDTHRVISFGPLINPKCAPSSTNPATGKPYGSAFPNFTFRDYAAIHRRALLQLGIDEIDVLAGASMGSLQAWHLTAQDFTKVRRVMLVVPGGLMLPQKTRVLAAKWVDSLEADPAWNKGDYYDLPPQQRPVAIQQVLADFWHRCQFPVSEAVVYEPDEEAWLAALANLKPLLPNINPGATTLSEVLGGLTGSQEPRVQRFIAQLKTLSAITDHNNLLWQLRTIGTFGAGSVMKETDDVRHGWMGDQAIEATRPNGQVMPRVLIIYSPDDDLFPQKDVLATKMAPLGLGQNVQVVALAPKSPHASGLTSGPLEHLGGLIRSWLINGTAIPSKL